MSGNLAAIETVRVTDQYGGLASRVMICAAMGSVIVERYMSDDGAAIRKYRQREITVPVDDVWATAERCVQTEREWAGQF